MVFQGLSRALSRTPNIADALSYANKDADFSVVEGLNAPLLSALIDARISVGLPPAVMAVTATNREAERLAAALSSLMPHAQLCDFPAWETLPHERLSPSPEIVGRRFEALRQMRDWDGSHPLVLITSVRGALQPIADNLGDVEPIALSVGSRGNDLMAIAAQLVDLAYVRVDMVTRRGEFAVRGGILDVFPPVADHPIRVDFFGDEVDSIRAFSVADQRSLDSDIQNIALPPSRELLLTAPVRQRAREMEHEFPGINQMLSKIAEGIAVEGMESLTPALVDRLVPITSYLPQGAAVALLSPERIATRAINLTETNREFLHAAWNAASAGAQSPIDLSAGDFLTVTELRTQYSGGAWWTFSAFQHGPDASEPLPEELDLDEILAIRINAKAVPTFAGNVDGAVDHVEALLKQDWTVIVAAEGHGLVERAGQVLSERNLAARMVAELPG